jgi:hypothetical protein
MPARKSTPAAQPTKRTAAAKVAPTSPAPSRSGLDFEALAAGAKAAKALPTVVRNGRKASTALADLITRSHAEGKPFSLPPVASEAAVKTLTTALRRAASQAGLGVSVRSEQTADGQYVVTIQGREKRER